MDRFIVKEPRVGAGFPQGNQMMAFPSNARSGNMLPENLYYNGYPPNFLNVQQMGAVGNPTNMTSPHLVQAQTQMNSPHLGQTQTFQANPAMLPGYVSGIDPRYLARYTDDSPQYILEGQQIQRKQPISTLGSDYQNRGLVGVDRNKPNLQNMQHPQVMNLGGLEPTKVEAMPKQQSFPVPDTKNTQNQQTFHKKFQSTKVEEISKLQPYTIPESKTSQNQPTFQNKFQSSNKPSQLDLIRNDCQMLMMTRTDKLKALNKSGPRAFSGPIEKVLKWHKTLQEVGILVIYEIVGKCVSVRSGDNCAKNLVVRDDSGPAMQVVYYEIDFLLPELKPPCTVRVVGRMMAGTCRLQAFNVRAATGDDVATLPRRAAVAAHHVAKLCKEYGHV